MHFDFSDLFFLVPPFYIFMENWGAFCLFELSSMTFDLVVRLLNTHISESNTWWQSGRRVSDAGPTRYRTAAVSSQANNSTLVTFSVLHPSFPVLCRLPSTLKRDLSLAGRVFRRSALSPCCCECCGRVCASVWRAGRAAAPTESRDAQKQRFTHPLPVTHVSSSRPFRSFLWDVFNTKK